MNRRGFIGLLFAAPAVGPSLVRGLSKTANVIAPQSVTAQDLAQFLNDHIAAHAVNLDQLRAGANALLSQSVKLVAKEPDAIGMPVTKIAQRHADQFIRSAVRDSMQVKREIEQSKQRARDAFKEMEG